MYVGTKHIASAVDDIAVDYTCKHCGHRAIADVIAVGQGSADAPFFLGQELARSYAAEQAGKALPGAAVRAAALAGCPRCDKPSASASRAAWVDATLAALASWTGAAALVIGLFAGIVFYITESYLKLALAVAAFGALLYVLARGQHRKIVRDSKARVTWREEKAESGTTKAPSGAVG